ncbi:porin [Herbaspirillum seropedicae]|uniref:Outer membrane porin, OmpC family protein n=1 Tax=Herbaspirillum seropedicae (strain SmR1) TaxID=757424 RepID=D8IP27_HERSS|nr:porin [Herbaspirillum seropedicae]ADJ62847.1 outer membrane porin, OmpC family protein [Herbaspirillum seropedicae SmR1]AKN64937.1 porin [Herbaspirillum seropedicae]NQE31258.1 porin [Herbaspirillum seropedicae]UMU20882.1 porin [Herbaspirillum seropedicae]
MKKAWAVGVASLLCAGGALAQSNVTLYGVIDTYMGYTNATGKGSVASLDSGGYQASRVGFKGSEDLGGGLRANFQMENGFASDSGAMHDSTRLFNRQSWVGLGNELGELRLGRQNSPGFLMIARLDAFAGATYASFLNNVSAYTPRYDNVIGYLSPVMRGFRVQAYYGLGEQTAPRNGLSTAMLAGEYESGPLYLGVSSSAQNSANDNITIRSTFAGGAYDYGSGKVFLGYYRGNNLGAAASANTPGSYYSAYSLSANYRLTGQATLGAGYGWAKDSTGAGRNARQFSLIGTYDLSRRTMLYATYAHLANNNGASFSLAGAAPITKNAPVSGGTVNGVQVGIRHLF